LRKGTERLRPAQINAFLSSPSRRIEIRAGEFWTINPRLISQPNIRLDIYSMLENMKPMEVRGSRLITIYVITILLLTNWGSGRFTGTATTLEDAKWMV
jgi:hypothetical protein